MFIKKDSLLLRIISYNGIAIIMISIVMALLFGIMIFNELNMRLLDKSRERTLLVNKAYLSLIEKTKETLNDVSNDAINLVLVDSNDEFIKNKLADVIKNQLNVDSYSLYNKSYIQVLSSKNLILGESGDREIKYDLYLANNINPSLSTLENVKYEFLGTKNDLYVRIIYPYRVYKSHERNYIVLTLPLKNYSLSKVKEYAYLSDEDKIFFTTKEGKSYGELYLEKPLDFFKNFKFNKVARELSSDKYYFSEKKVGGNNYYLGMLALKNSDNTYIGNIGVAISKSSSIAIKYMLATMILAVCLLSVVISTTLCARIFARLLRPLMLIADKTSEIGIYNNLKKDYDYEVNFDEENIFEIRSISNSLKNMAKRIEENETLLRENNNKLNFNLNRIITIENILIGVDINKNFIESIDQILHAMTSEVGLGYSRAIYMHYDKERNELTAKNYSVNAHIVSNIEKYTQGISGFKFQLKDIENMLPLLNVKYEPGGIFWESMNSRKIIYHNDKGFKYTFGNKLFKALGLRNFMVLPIADKEIKVGCIIVDYFGRDRTISEEEVELNALLLMNFLIRVKNNMLEEDKLMKERYLTMTKISSKFISNNKNLINNVETFIEKIKNNRYNSKDIDKIIRYVRDEKKRNVVLNYSVNNNTNNFRPFNLERLIDKIVKNSDRILRKYGINISVFVDFSGEIYGDKKKIYQLFLQILRNSINSILVRNKLDKKINIVVITDKDNRVIIDIVDNGIGMTEEEVNGLMKPYTETENRVKNIMGMGLITIYKIVKEHKGLVSITSELDVGTKVRIIFNKYREEKINE